MSDTLHQSHLGSSGLRAEEPCDDQDCRNDNRQSDQHWNYRGLHLQVIAGHAPCVTGCVAAPVLPRILNIVGISVTDDGRALEASHQLWEDAKDRHEDDD